MADDPEADPVAELRAEFAEVRALALRATNESAVMATALYGPPRSEIEGGGRNAAVGLVGRCHHIEQVVDETLARLDHIEGHLAHLTDKARNGGIPADVSLSKWQKRGMYATVVSAIAAFVSVAAYMMFEFIDLLLQVT